MIDSGYTSWQNNAALNDAKTFVANWIGNRNGTIHVISKTAENMHLGEFGTYEIATIGFNFYANNNTIGNLNAIDLSYINIGGAIKYVKALTSEQASGFTIYSCALNDYTTIKIYVNLTTNVIAKVESVIDARFYSFVGWYDEDPTASSTALSSDSAYEFTTFGDNLDFYVMFMPEATEAAIDIYTLSGYNNNPEYTESLAGGTLNSITIGSVTLTLNNGFTLVNNRYTFTSYFIGTNDTAYVVEVIPNTNYEIDGYITAYDKEEAIVGEKVSTLTSWTPMGADDKVETILQVLLRGKEITITFDDNLSEHDVSMPAPITVRYGLTAKYRYVDNEWTDLTYGFNAFPIRPLGNLGFYKATSFNEGIDT